MTDEKTRALIAELREAHEDAGQIPQGTMVHDTQWRPFARLYNAAGALLDALSALTVSDGDARERLLGVLAKHGHVEWDDLDVATVADAILAAIPIPSRDIAGEKCSDCGDRLELVGTPDGQGDYLHCWRCWYRDHPEALRELIAGEIEAEASRYAGPFEKGLRRAAEIARNGR